MTHFRRARQGLAVVLGVAGIGVLASCVSGSVDPNGSDLATGGQGNAATGNVGPSGGGQNIAGGSSSGGAHGGTTSAQGGASGTNTQSTGGSGALGGSAGMPGTGGTQAAAGSTSTGGKGAGGSTGMAGTTGAAGTTSGPQPLPPISGGSTGFASRFWDCCKPSCGGGKLACGSDGHTSDGGGSACSGGSAYACYNLAPFVDSANPYVAYAFGATNPQACGACYEVQFTGPAGCSDSNTCPANAPTIVYNTLYIQGVNTGNDLKSGQFDIMIPGGGVGIFNACSSEWSQSNSALGAQYGGFFSGQGSSCNGDVTCYNNKCNSVFAGKPDMLAGCLWFSSWFKAADNPQIKYTKVACPKQLTDKSGISG